MILIFGPQNDWYVRYIRTLTRTPPTTPLAAAASRSSSLSPDGRVATGNRQSRSPAASAAGGVVADGSAAGGSEPNGVAVSRVAARQQARAV